MAKLIFTYAVMNAGKSTQLLAANNNYISEKKETLVLSHSIDNRFGSSLVTSRMGISFPATSVTHDTNVFDLVVENLKTLDDDKKYSCIFVDEIQFFSKEQVFQLSDIVDQLNIPVMAYGLRNDFKGNLFEGSAAMFAIADEIRALKQVCFCNKDSKMVLRYDEKGNIERDGNSIKVGAESMYRSVCRHHWKLGDLGERVYSELGVEDPFASQR